MIGLPRLDLRNFNLKSKIFHQFFRKNRFSLIFSLKATKVGVVLVIAISIVLRAILVMVVVTIPVAGVLISLVVCSSA